MAEFKMLLPEMGEGVMEATVIKWSVNEGDAVTEDQELIEIATDKVDSDVPSPCKGKITKLLVNVGDVVKIGDAIAIIEVEDVLNNTSETNEAINLKNDVIVDSEVIELNKILSANKIALKSEKPEIEAEKIDSNQNLISNSSFSPLVKSIILEEKISNQEIEKIKPTGLNNRITKVDVLDFLENRNLLDINQEFNLNSNNSTNSTSTSNEFNLINSNKNSLANLNFGDEVLEIDRMRKLISNHMVTSKNTAVHVTSFVEADVTKIVNWRNKFKDSYKNREGEPLTFTPIFVEAIVKSLLDFPMLNISFDGEKIIKKKNINIGIATALPSGNLIVPVVKNADKLSLLELSKEINSLIYKARNNKLQPKDITEGTYTVSNIGTFGNIIGTPIINQPQVAIMALGTIKKKPSVIETKEGDFIGIRQKMFLSHSYDHRIIDGFLGGSFAQRVSEYLENFNQNREI